ncbi:MAG: ADP-ribosylglycohydrolase family protein [Candidatus Riflebacteria bacterium]|nr:ADP-ribosylglycohydrolase family protein [Candidatus Riflebacteria bacterium]
MRGSRLFRTALMEGMDRAVSLGLCAAIVVLLVGPCPARAAAVQRVLASQLATGTVSVEYSTGPQREVALIVDGAGLTRAKGIEIGLESQKPTQVRIYTVSEFGHSWYRYVVFTPGNLRRKLVLPLASFDPDPLQKIQFSPPGGGLKIVDCPGYLRESFKNRLTVGPLRMLGAPVDPPADEVPPGPEADRDELYRKILGGWIGKAAGGAAGTPFEGDLTPAWKYLPRLRTGLLGYVWGMGPDDDTSFEVQHLLVVQAKGRRFTGLDLAESWRNSFAYEYLWKTERHSLENLAKGIQPPKCGEGPKGESLCARIRADLWGYLSLGDPAQAISFVARDAPLSNSGAGLRDAEFVATAVSLAFRPQTVPEPPEATLAAVPVAKSPHADVIRKCRDDFKAGRSIEEAYARLKKETFDPISKRDPTDAWVYALPNAGLVTLALLYGRGDFAQTVALAAALGWDSDCNAGTVGAILGVLGTDKGIPAPPLLQKQQDEERHVFQEPGVDREASRQPQRVARREPVGVGRGHGGGEHDP